MARKYFLAVLLMFSTESYATGPDDLSTCKKISEDEVVTVEATNNCPVNGMCFQKVRCESKTGGEIEYSFSCTMTKKGKCPSLKKCASDDSFVVLPATTINGGSNNSNSIGNGSSSSIGVE